MTVPEKLSIGVHPSAPHLGDNPADEKQINLEGRGINSLELLGDYFVYCLFW